MSIKLICLLPALLLFSFPDGRGRNVYEKQDEDYQLVWADEFDLKGKPDPQKWRFENGFVRNNELQWYQEENAFCDSGLLIIEARRERFPNRNFVSGSSDWREAREHVEYTSASLNTLGKNSWKFGRFVMRARIDVSPGLWPAFWTLGVDGEWPSNGEIDIMEYYNGNILANIAHGTNRRFAPRWINKIKPVKEFNDPEWAEKFHVWRMDWDEDHISLFVDDELLVQANTKDLRNTDPAKENPFLKPHYILINLAVGGDNGGDPASTIFPKRLEVDYVRVYQKRQKK